MTRRRVLAAIVAGSIATELAAVLVVSAVNDENTFRAIVWSAVGLTMAALVVRSIRHLPPAESS